MIISINWEISNEKCQLFDLTEGSLNRWFWVFETLRTYGLKIFRLEDHIDRLFRSADIIWLKSKYWRDDVWRDLENILKEWICQSWNLKFKIQNREFDKEARIKITLTENYLIIYFSLNEFDTSIYKWVWACFYEAERFLPEAKSLNCLVSHLANTHAKDRGLFEAILINRDWYVSEWAYSNIFWIKSWVLYTSSKGILDWITRQTILDKALDYVKDVKFENKMTVGGLKKVNELFMSQSSKWIVPIVRLEGLEIWDWDVGSYTWKLSEIF